MLLENEQIAIIGAGSGGLTLARRLHKEGVNIKVYERDTNQQIRQQGATLDLHYEFGLKALRAGGLMEVFRNNY
ncbi:NAD(P)-binding protein [Mucilaginibacter sp. Bleaf8]|uniref:FAD-dependent oxidoreductase n=1 Tax=Mucilaginibacter sp. Bleaf8 TaxID=2834430 RepID=UPI001BCD2437|nr:NAD(P)-binding protein [Mucilaginibacter sp. Bleaf8]MBS7562784.1 NAD(P)-binding protein [Mucilaginibacter sp. Bleaf8]